jgi:hypothetical protein
LVAILDELDELDPVDGRQRCGSRLAPDLLAQPQERAHAVDRDPAGRRGAEIVAEDLMADRSLVADRREPAQHRRHWQIPLTRQTAVMAAEMQEIHLDRRRIGDLDEDDPLGRDLGDVIDRQAFRQHVVAVENEADVRMIGHPHGLPCLSIVVDVPTPGERFEADGDAELAGKLAQIPQIGCDLIQVAGRIGRGAAAHQKERRTEPPHQLELASGALERLGAQWLRQSLEVTERLQGNELETE